MKKQAKIFLFFLIALLGGAGYVYSEYLVDRPAASWHMINVNAGKLQGDANLIMIDGVTVMIDAGYVSEAKTGLIPYLNRLGITHIDHFFISHPHRDHYEGLAPILGSGISIGKMYYRIPAAEVKDCCYSKKHFLKFIDFARDHGVELVQPESGFKLSLPEGSTLEILHAQDGNLATADLDVNDMSMIMKWRINGVEVLFPGDLNQKLGRVLASDPRMQADILKAPHHGAESLAPKAFFDSVNPAAMLVPAPAWLWCGDRGRQTREWAHSRQTPTWVNGINGNIKVEFYPGRFLITPEKSSNECKFKQFGILNITVKNH